jgi:hypothetical protein
MVHSHDLTVDGEVPRNISVDGNEIQKVTIDGELVWEWHPYIGFEEDNPLQDWYQDGNTDLEAELGGGYEGQNALFTKNKDKYSSRYVYDLQDHKQTPVKVSWWFKTKDDWYFDYGVKLLYDQKQDSLMDVTYRDSNNNLVFSNYTDTHNTGYDPLGKGWHQVVIKNIDYTNYAHVMLKAADGTVISEKSQFALENGADGIENFAIFHDADGDSETYTQSYHDQIRFKQG